MTNDSSEQQETLTPRVQAIVKQQTPWEFACEWYNADQIHKSLARRKMDGHYDPTPEDVHSARFSEWLTNQYRLAMAKGIEIGKQMAEGKSV